MLGPDDGLLIPADLLLSYDGRYMYVTNWFANTVQQFDITDPFEPVLNSTVSVPHANMLRLSQDNRRLYVTNSLLSPWDDDTRFGPARNDEYGLWRFDVRQAHRQADVVHPATEARADPRLVEYTSPQGRRPAERRPGARSRSSMSSSTLEPIAAGDRRSSTSDR